jgi:hypothetical protein
MESSFREAILETKLKMEHLYQNEFLEIYIKAVNSYFPELVSSINNQLKENVFDDDDGVNGVRL